MLKNCQQINFIQSFLLYVIGFLRGLSLDLAGARTPCITQFWKNIHQIYIRLLMAPQQFTAYCVLYCARARIPPNYIICNCRFPFIYTSRTRATVYIPSGFMYMLFHTQNIIQFQYIKHTHEHSSAATPINNHKRRNVISDLGRRRRAHTTPCIEISDIPTIRPIFEKKKKLPFYQGNIRR